MRAPAALALAFLLAAPSSARAEQEESLLDRLVAVVQGSPVTLYDVDRSRTEPDLGTALVGLPPMLPAPRTHAWALDRSILDELAIQAARDLGVEASEQQVTHYLAELKRQNRWSDVDLQRELSQLGFSSVPDARRAVRRTLSIGQVTRIKVGSRVSVDEKELEERLAGQYGDGREDEVLLRQILVRLPAILRPQVEVDLFAHMEGVRKDIASGRMTFEEAARRYSDSPDGKEGGLLGWTRRGTYPFDADAFDLEPGEISPVVRSYLGYHLLKVEQRRRVEIGSRERLRRAIAQDLYEQRFKREKEGWLQEIRERAVVRVLDTEPLVEGEKR
jgi:peptidyl-prolyl cis-trans isomerase SurA